MNRGIYVTKEEGLIALLQELCIPSTFIQRTNETAITRLVKSALKSVEFNNNEIAVTLCRYVHWMTMQETADHLGMTHIYCSQLMHHVRKQLGLPRIKQYSKVCDS